MRRVASSAAAAAATAAAGAAAGRALRVVVNGRAVQVPDGSSLLDAVREAGAHVPTLCYSPRFHPRATCRLCVVEVAGQTRPQPACATAARDGDAVTTDSAALKRFREVDLQLLMARHPNACMRCEQSGSCKLQTLVQTLGVEERWPKLERGDAAHHPEHTLADYTSPAIARDLSKCIECGLCVDACGDEQGQGLNVIGFAERGGDALPVTVFDRPLSETNCISCGQCTLACPVGALTEKPVWQEVLDVLASRRRVTAVQVAPATRVAIGEEFGMAPGTVSTGRLCNALRELGFDFVFDTNFAADVTIMEEASELLARMRGERGPLPMFTSCCPGWINYVELSRPDLLPHLSTTKSPQQMHGALSKRGPFARRRAAELEAKRAATAKEQQPAATAADSNVSDELYVVSVMPCTAKKDEALRPTVRGDIDAVLTTRELARMIRARRIPFASLPNEARFDSPLGESTGAAQIFGASGGVLEAALRTAAHMAGLRDAPLEFKGVRGVAEGVKTAVVPGVGEVAAVSGIRAAQRLLADDEWRRRFVMIEVMACVGGCLGGGGEPKSDVKDILERRAKGVYAIDAAAPKRRSHENEDVARLYREHLGAPLSHEAERLLHTTYAPRRSPRALLGRFLDAVDRRDADGAVALFEPDGVWATNAPQFGEVAGRAAIAELVAKRLPPARAGADRARHRFEDASKGLVVHTPAGERVEFEAQVSEAGLFRRLARRVLPAAEPAAAP